MPQPNSILIPCSTCSTPFRTWPGKIRKGEGKFCSYACHNEAQRSVPMMERLWARVNKNGPIPPHRAEYGECWEFTGRPNPQGYGTIYRHFPDRVLTHRATWEEATDETLTSLDVIGHICDNPPCVRNDEPGWYAVAGVLLPRRGHLFKGAHTDNVADAKQKGRTALGERNGARTHPERVLRGAAAPWSKVTEDQVREIRRRYAAGGVTQTALGLEYGLHNVTISEIVLRKKWRHVE